MSHAHEDPSSTPSSHDPKHSLPYMVLVSWDSWVKAVLILQGLTQALRDLVQVGQVLPGLASDLGAYPPPKRFCCEA